MPIEMPKHTVNATPKVSGSDFVLCQNIAFRLSSVDGFSHHRYEDGSAVTILNFKGYTQNMADPQRQLFDFLILHINPCISDEAP